MKNLIMLSLQFSFIAGLAVTAEASELTTAHCVVKKIEVTEFDLVKFPAGTQQEIRFLELLCDETTIGPDSHQAFLNAPIHLLEPLKLNQKNNTKSVYAFTFKGYGGELKSIDGYGVGPVQPTVRAGTNFGFFREERYDEASRLSQILLANCSNCRGQVRLIAQDTPLFRITVKGSRMGSSPGGDGRGTPGDRFVSIEVEGAIEKGLRPGGILRFTSNDSRRISKFLLFKQFPGVFLLSSGSITCQSENACAVIQE